MKRAIYALTIVCLFVFVSTVQMVRILDEQQEYVPRERLGNHDFDPIIPTTPDDTYISYTEFRATIATATATAAQIEAGAAGKKIRFDSAEELYRFSIDVCYHPDQIYMTSDPTQNVKLSPEVIGVLLSLDYVLGQDIDYAVMKSRQFIPIGYSFELLSGAKPHNIFTGTFDGRGFEISNLYFADYDLLTTVDGEGEYQEDLALAPYYAMFPYNAGRICNLGIINPTFELTMEHTSIYRAANLVGHNTEDGVIENVYVIDNRDDIFRAGIRMRATVGAGGGDYQAAGIVFENDGIFIDSYYVSKVVINGSYINSFEVQPVLFTNRGTALNLAYDANVYQLTVNIGGIDFTVTAPNTLATGEETATLKSGSEVLRPGWFYYDDDRYPSLLGLAYDNDTDEYLIADARDLVIFAKLLNYITVYHDKPFRSSHYRLVDDIDMNQVSPTAYVPPSIEFSGQLSGDDGAGGRFYISRFALNNGIIIDGNYHTGMFTYLSGVVSDIVFYDASLTLTDTAAYYSSEFRIGLIAAVLDGGSILDVSVDLTADLGATSIGEMAAGGVVGLAGGRIEGVYIEGTFNAGSNRAYSSDHNVVIDYAIGGVVGKTLETRALRLYNILNAMEITGVGSTGAVVSSDATKEIKTGGIIGEVVNAQNVRHFLGWITNAGEINVSSLSTSGLRQYVGGVVGMSRGRAYELASGFGEWTNQGLLDFTGAGTNAVYAGGVAACGHEEAAELVCLYNDGGISVSNYTSLQYAALVCDVSTHGFTLSQSTNYANFTINADADFRGVYHNPNASAPVLLRFVENEGDITYHDRTFNREVSIAAITLKENVDFLNVYNKGQITLYSITNNSYSLWIAGIAKTLSNNKYMRNCLNEGDIILANYNTPLTVSSGTTYTGNVYISGLVNLNYAGDLQNQDDSNRPVATYGIINSVNYGNLKSTYSSTIYGIKGQVNIFAGGVVTINRGSVQDVINMGNVTFANLSDLNSNLIDIDDNEYVAGSVKSFRGGITAGGVAAAVGAGTSRIYDSANSGEVLAVAKNYARAGGILAVCLYSEITAGSVPTSFLVNTIQSSILSNCINYGKISSVTKTIVEYSTKTTTSRATQYYADTSDGRNSVTTTEGTNERPGIYSSAGGVIGYGLSVMRRMVNHGDVSSTDVAGGIIGATYVTGGSSTVTTTVSIDTAIHYGSVRAVNVEDRPSGQNNYDLINKVNMSYADISSYFYDPDDDFIFPHNTVAGDITRWPEGKRGIGGIFGRLQRGRNGQMTASGSGGNFDFIVNMDPNVDLIGRLDQVYEWSSTARYYIFPDCIYYSARINDTTQAVFTGYEYFYETSITQSDRLRYTYQVERINNERYRYEYVGGTWRRYTQQYVERFSETSIYATMYYAIGGTAYNKGRVESVVTSTLINAEWRDVSDSATVVSGGPYEEYSNPWRLSSTIETYFNRTQSNLSSYTYYRGKNIPMRLITENPYALHGEFVYAEDFEMRDDSTLLSNDEPITSYIYYVENGVLSDFFRPNRLYGMYVLSTSSGSTFGSVLPANTDLTDLYRLKEILPFDSDYETIDSTKRDPLSQDIRDSYTALLQTRYSDKSALLEEGQSIWLEEVGGSGTVLINPTINYNTRTITFELSLQQIISTQTTTTFRIASAVVPAMAMVAARIEDFDGGSYLSDLAGFVELLSADEGQVISSNAPPDMSFNAYDYRDISSNTTIDLGYFTVYSQAAYSNTVFLTDDNYSTDYLVRLTLKPRLGAGVQSPQPSTVVVDGTSRTYSNYIANPPTLAQTITVNFTDPQRVLTAGWNIGQYIKLYYGTTEVDPAYYELQVASVSSSGDFSFTMTFSDALRAGDYTIKYKYYHSDEPPHELPVVRGGSSTAAILYLRHYSYDEMTDPPGASFTTYVNFGYDFDFENLSWSVSTEDDFPPYLDNRTYEVSYLDAIVLSPYTTITNITFNPATDIVYNNGYRTYRIHYSLTAGNGTTTATYTHNITERPMELTEVFKNQNRVSIDNVFCAREAEVTNFAVDLGVDQSYAARIYNLYADNPDSYFVISVIGETMGGTAYTPEEIVGIAYSADRYLNIIIDKTTKPGRYYFTFRYYRDGQVIVVEDELMITKNLGTSAYITDIRFAESAVETSYGTIFVSDHNGIEVVSEYRPRIYYAGIDYDGADVAGVADFRIIGYVANIPLVEYTPIFLPYLPPGSTVSRLAYSSQYPNGYWTPEVNDESAPELKATLATDFTLMPRTGQDPGEDEDVIITYRVTSENGQSVVYYHITVTDIVYNVSIIFDIFYDDNGTLIPAHEAAAIKDLVLLINVRNFNTDVPIGVTPEPTVADFPAFTEITGYNNSMLMFYLPTSSAYKYRFGRNMSGYFSFTVDLPVSSDGYSYTYSIYFEGDELNDVSDYVTGADGKYFYICAGTKPRSRRFEIRISRASLYDDPNWGLHDNQDSWK